MLSQGSEETIQSVKCFCTHVKTGWNSILPSLGSRYRWLLGAFWPAILASEFQANDRTAPKELEDTTPKANFYSDPHILNCLLKIFIYMWEACGGQRTTCWSQFPFYHVLQGPGSSAQLQALLFTKSSC